MPTLPYITTEQMIEVDRLMEEVYHINLIQMMENAGRNLADLACSRFLLNSPVGKRIVILAGSGGNGGGGLVAARHLANRGVLVDIVLSSSHEKYLGVPGHQLDIVERIGINVALADSNWSVPEGNLIIDAMIGYSINGAPRGLVRTLIGKINEVATPVLSLDVPSGLDSTRGAVHSPVVKAAATMTLALPKTGLLEPGTDDIIGELYVADISVPPALFAEHFDLDISPLFAETQLVKVNQGS